LIGGKLEISGSCNVISWNVSTFTQTAPSSELILGMIVIRAQFGTFRGCNAINTNTCSFTEIEPIILPSMRPAGVSPMSVNLVAVASGAKRKTETHIVGDENRATKPMKIPLRGQSGSGKGKRAAQNEWAHGTQSPFSNRGDSVGRIHRGGYVAQR
jgi:hypothetical protein